MSFHVYQGDHTARPTTLTKTSRRPVDRREHPVQRVQDRQPANEGGSYEQQERHRAVQPQPSRYAVRLWLPKEFSRGQRVPFHKLTELAAEMLAQLALPGKSKVIVLFDSYYLCPVVIQASRGW